MVLAIHAFNYDLSFVFKCWKNQLKVHLKKKIAFAQEVELLNSAKGLHEILPVG